MTAEALLHEWIARQVAPSALDWLQTSLERIAVDSSDQRLYLAVSLASGKVGKADLELSDADLAAAKAVRPGWDPTGWSVDQATRIRLLLATKAAMEPRPFADRLDRLCQTADVAELVAFYRGLPLYPKAETLVARAAEGVRSNMKPVFEAVAHRNPFPFEQFPEPAWNQMVLKALFVGSRLAPIIGLDERTNPTLAEMLVHYAKERRAANRPVSPELWRAVGPFLPNDGIGILLVLVEAGSPDEQRAAAWTLRASQSPTVRAVVDSLPSSWRELPVDWSSLGGM